MSCDFEMTVVESRYHLRVRYVPGTELEVGFDGTDVVSVDRMRHPRIGQPAPTVPMHFADISPGRFPGHSLLAPQILATLVGPTVEVVRELPRQRFEFLRQFAPDTVTVEHGLHPEGAIEWIRWYGPDYNVFHDGDRIPLDDVYPNGWLAGSLRVTDFERHDGVVHPWRARLETYRPRYEGGPYPRTTVDLVASHEIEFTSFRRGPEPADYLPLITADTVARDWRFVGRSIDSPLNLRIEHRSEGATWPGKDDPRLVSLAASLGHAAPSGGWRTLSAMAVLLLIVLLPVGISLYRKLCKPDKTHQIRS